VHCALIDTHKELQTSIESKQERGRRDDEERRDEEIGQKENKPKRQRMGGVHKPVRMR
jgi:hypothetical protein